ncbi:hypothetical protein BJF78_18980 [Pseudonocardia sp. CNS-139]|nr:hypothetical protein BJF78_18980 [Pseudonocardia sp. CNS-139]
MCSASTVTGRPVVAVISRSSSARRVATVCPHAFSADSGWCSRASPRVPPSRSTSACSVAGCRASATVSPARAPDRPA